MNTNERRAIRQPLHDLGFKRVSMTQDLGNGAYVEVFQAPDGSLVNINWAPKTPDEPVVKQPRVAPVDDEWRRRQRVLDTECARFEGDGNGMARYLKQEYGVEPAHTDIWCQSQWSEVAEQIATASIARQDSR